jgi:hypothetical protein
VEDRRVINRRVGPRVALDPLEVAWRVAPPGSTPREQRKHRPQRGSLLDLSVSGALVAAPQANELSAGAVLYMAIDDQVGKVRIRRIIDSPDRGMVRYGIEFVELGSDLTRYVHGALQAMVGSPAYGRRDDDELT